MLVRIEILFGNHLPPHDQNKAEHFVNIGVLKRTGIYGIHIQGY